MSNISVPAAATGLPSVTPTIRRRMERAVERLLAALDAIDAPSEDLEPDSDFEEGADTEPSLGAGEVEFGAAGHPLARGHINQTRWVDTTLGFQFGNCDMEAVDEYGGDINDEPQDGDELDDDGLWKGEQDPADMEPTLGAPENPHDQTHWAQGNREVDELEIDENGKVSRYMSAEQSEANREAAAMAKNDLGARIARRSGRASNSPENLPPFGGLVIPFSR